MEITNKDKQLAKITRYFGIETELTKLSEEVGELLNECYKRVFVDPEAGNVEDEMADVVVILMQICIHFNLDMNTVFSIFDEKVDRTVKRIDEGWYNQHR